MRTTPLAPARPSPAPPAGRTHEWTLLAALSVSAAMGGLDASIVNTVLPVVTRAFGSDVATTEWVITVYLLVLSGLLLSVGRLGDLWGHRPLYLRGLLVFVLGSGLSGLAPSVELLVAARALQALGAAMVSATAPAILTAAIPAARRGRAFGINAMAVYLGLVVGPGLGGLLADHWGWRAVFYVTVPVGLLAFAVSARVVPAGPPPRRDERFDWWGAGTFTLGLMALLLGLNQGHAWGWSAPATVGCFALAACTLGLFLVLEQRLASPMLDLSLFGQRLFSAAIASAVLNYMAAYAVVFLTPFYLLQARGLSPSQTGLIVSAMPVVMVLVAPISGALSDRFGSRALAVGGMTVLTLGLFLLSRLTVDTPLPALVAALMVAGLGIGTFSSPNTNAALGAAPAPRRGVASAVLGTGRNLGMVLGIGLAGAALTTGLAGATDTPAQAIAQGVDAGFLLAAAVAAVGIFTSAARG